MASRIARWPPAAASRPCTSTMTRSARRSTSFRTCELTMTVRPCAPSRRKRSMRAPAARGRRRSAARRARAPAVAHERGGDLGPLAHALAEAVDAPIGDVEQADRPSAASGAPGRRPGAGRRCSARTAGRSAPPAPLRPRARGPCRRWTRRSGAGRGPRRGPALVDADRAVIARISVVLPAPFGPSRPVTPGPNEQLSSDSATFAPNHTDTSATSTVGSTTNAGSSTGDGRRIGSGHRSTQR